jgi:hypothetical protein
MMLLMLTMMMMMMMQHHVGTRRSLCISLVCPFAPPRFDNDHHILRLSYDFSSNSQYFTQPVFFYIDDLTSPSSLRR